MKYVICMNCDREMDKELGKKSLDVQTVNISGVKTLVVGFDIFKCSKCGARVLVIKK